MISGIWYTENYTDGVALSLKVKEHLVSKRTPFQKLDMYETEKYGTLLTLGDLVMTTAKDEFVYHELITHVPLFAHTQPERVLIIGGGDGGTAREVVKHPTVTHVDLVEIDQEVVDMSKQYMPSLSKELTNPKVHLFFQDAVEFVKTVSATYDVIIIDSTDPIGPGEGLFNKEFYMNCLKLLNDTGILSAQAESVFNCPDWVQQTFAKLREVFPVVKAYLGTIPTYPGGLWSFAFCCKQPEIVHFFDEARYEKLQLDLRYYNKTIHRACFALPNFVQELCQGK
ncbi:MAG: polyamine aminopropyltransferase [Candidatus Vecturithrix sp.]|jgi:spermidine synthase|nr:polyamine aminopropyltransferase [Candidatus Vecturithrix sp.]